MNWFFWKRGSKASEPGRRFRPGLEFLEGRTVPASLTDPLTTVTEPTTTTATVSTLASTTPTLSMSAAVDQFAKYSLDRLKQLDKGLASVEMIAHLEDLFGLMADHMKAGTGIGFDLGAGQSDASVSANVANLFAQFQKSMDGPNFADFLKILDGPTSAPLSLDAQMKLAQANVTKAFETVGSALAALGIRDVRIVLGGSSDGGCVGIPGTSGSGVSGAGTSSGTLSTTSGAAGSWGAFIKVPGSGSTGDGWAFLMSVPGLQQQGVTNLLDQWKPGTDPTTSADPAESMKQMAGCIADFAGTGAGIGAVMGLVLGDEFGPVGSLTGAAAGGTVGGAVGTVVGVGVCVADALTKPTTDPNKSLPAPDGGGLEKYDRSWGWYKPTTSASVSDPAEELEKATFDMARFVRTVVSMAVSKVNPNPEGGTTGGTGTSGSTGTVAGAPVGGLVGGDPSDDQPVVTIDMSSGGNPIVIFMPPRTPDGK